MLRVKHETINFRKSLSKIGYEIFILECFPHTFKYRRDFFQKICHQELYSTFAISIIQKKL